MTQHVSVTYTYAIPNDQFVDNFSEGLTKTFTYNGPEELIVTVPEGGSAYTQKLDGVVYDNEQTVVINVTTNPELLPTADLLWGRPDGLEAAFDNVTLEDGTVYAEQNNCTIHDYYWMPVYNEADESWPTELKLILKDTLSPKMRTALAKADMFIEILELVELSTDNATKLDAYKTAVEAYRNVVAMPWKYPGTNPFDLVAPKIPMELVNSINDIKAAGVSA
jgi:hypothetical protein